MKTVSIEELKEKLAEIEHMRWSDWQKWLHSKLTMHNGVKGQCKPGLLMSPADYQHWEEQIAADYEELSDSEKASDMEQVDRYWPLIEALIHDIEVQSRIDELTSVMNNLNEWVTYKADNGHGSAVSVAKLYDRIRELEANQHKEEK